MLVERDWEVLPIGDLGEQSNWRSLSGNRFAALRVLLRVVRIHSDDSRLGTALEAHPIAPGDEIHLKWRRERVITRTDTMSEAIRFATTSRICDTLSAKLTTELSAKAVGFSGKLGTELLTSQEYEITQHVERSLEATTSHMIQEIEAAEHEIILKGNQDVRIAELRRRYWPRQWNVYLYSYDYLELSYRKTWFWWQVRDTIKQTHSGILGWPLVSLTYYEPQADVNVTYGPIDDVLESPDEIEVNPSVTAMPRSRPPGLEPLEQLARYAFPVTSTEKSVAADRKKKAAAKPTGKKAAKKKAAKKAAARKAVKKKAVRRKAAKRSARRR